MDTDSCKEQFKKNKLFLSAVKSYAKKEWKYTHPHYGGIPRPWKKWNFLDKCEFGGFLMVKGIIWFRNREYKIKDLWEVFLREYMKQLLNGYENYCNLTEIKQHLQKVINT